MRFVKDLSPVEIDQIVQTLEADGFKKIKVHPKSISFSMTARDTVERSFVLHSTNIYAEQDLGLDMDFDYEEFLAKNYEIKTRHSISLADAIEAKGSVEEACEKLGWKIKQVKDLARSSEWKVEAYSLMIYEVMISSLMHIIVEKEDENKSDVYTGDISKIWAMGTETVEDILSGKSILSILKALDQTH